MNLKNIFFTIFFLVFVKVLSQKNPYNPFAENNYATFETCTDENQKESCFKNILIYSLTENFNYSLKKTRKNKDGIEIYFSFKVDSLGQKGKIFFFESPELELKDKLILNILKLPKMIPALSEGIPGNTEFFLKLFIIPENENIFSVINIKTKFNIPKKEFSETCELDLIEIAPIFPGCTGESELDLRLCFQKNIFNHIKKNFRYPEHAQKYSIQGKVLISFMIDREGYITELNAKGPHPSLELEALQIFSKLPKFTPGIQRGRIVKVPFSLPLTFKLQ